MAQGHWLCNIISQQAPSQVTIDEDEIDGEFEEDERISHMNIGLNGDGDDLNDINDIPSRPAKKNKISIVI
ncbi:hypothetical protein BCR42DRAFT_438222 [Absidia repens]|uniref:Uncharacterized protein n=1 Tax=Absidia repens TaxID=90262 RepID=A0A1X2IE65_9FUNG|nr:hypothetical protein BCR42DRAFT_438222 [Absidia repens]